MKKDNVIVRVASFVFAAILILNWPVLFKILMAEQNIVNIVASILVLIVYTGLIFVLIAITAFFDGE